MTDAILELKGLFKWMNRVSDVVSMYVEQRTAAASDSLYSLNVAEEEKYRIIYNFYVRNVSFFTQKRMFVFSSFS